MAGMMMDAVAATQGPGLPIALLIGLEAAQSVAYALRRPFLGIHHHEAHLYSPWIVGKPPRADYDALEPHVALVVSGGIQEHWSSRRVRSDEGQCLAFPHSAAIVHGVIHCQGGRERVS